MKSNTRTALIAATLLTGVAGVAAAQGLSSIYDPAQLPAIKGKVAQYDLTPRGDVDGLILDDGTEVHFPPHLGLQVVAAVRPGDAVTIHGLKARSLPLVMAMSVTADASNKTIVDEGPDGREHGPRGPFERHHHFGPGPMGGPEGGPMGGPPPGGPMAGPMGGPGAGPMGGPMDGRLTAQGTVKMQLHGPRGELNGVLLDNGTFVHLPPPEAARLGDQLKVGQTVAVRGFGSATTLGTSIETRAIGPSADKLTDLPRPPMPPHFGPGFPGGPMGGPGAPPPPPPGGPMGAPPAPPAPAAAPAPAATPAR